MFVNSSLQRQLADCALINFSLAHVLSAPYSKHVILYKNVFSRQIVKTRQIATPSTSQMKNFLKLIHVYTIRFKL